MENKFNICIIGAGIAGLAIAESLSRLFENIIVIDKERTFGQHISSRNSEVIHSGFYYPKNSLKSKLCISGNDMLYQFAKKYHIKHKKCGKLIVINKKEDESKLISISKHAIDCGLAGLKILDKDEAKSIEPKVNCYKALYIPSTGIIDSHGVMSKLESISKLQDVDFLYKTDVTSIELKDNLYRIYINGSKECIISDVVINTAGLWSDAISKMVGIDSYEIEYYKGDYFKSQSIKNLNCLIYPLPKMSSLGIHTVLSLNGDVSFGPNLYKVNKIDYSIDDRFKERYIQEISNHGSWKLISSGTIPPDPTRILSSRKMHEFVQILREDDTFDIIGLKEFSPGKTLILKANHNDGTCYYSHDCDTAEVDEEYRFANHFDITTSEFSAELSVF